jgi:hypothetical protein
MKSVAVPASSLPATPLRPSTSRRGVDDSLIAGAIIGGCQDDRWVGRMNTSE